VDNSVDNLWITLWITFKHSIRTDESRKIFPIVALGAGKVVEAELSTKLSTGYPQVIHNFLGIAIAATEEACTSFFNELSTFSSKYNNNNTYNIIN
jgi:hypothetical protein